MKRKEIMAPSDPMEVYQMSNYKSPCVCDECINKKVDQIQINNPFNITSPEPKEKSFEEGLNFENLCKQQEILKELRDLLEIRPSVVETYKKSFCSSDNNCTHAIEGLTSDSRMRVQQLCQEWWDVTQEDASIFKMAIYYQQYVSENFVRSSIQNQKLSESDINSLSQANFEKSRSIRQSVVL